jgi:hypothetical protein
MDKAPFNQRTSHQKMVTKLTKPGQDILDTLTPEKVNLWHMATLIAGEAGELLDAVKKHVVYNKELDVPNVIEEMGDLEFGLEGARQALQLARNTILKANEVKLLTGKKARYKEGTYTDKQAQDRADKQ